MSTQQPTHTNPGARPRLPYPHEVIFLADDTLGERLIGSGVLSGRYGTYTSTGGTGCLSYISPDIPVERHGDPDAIDFSTHNEINSYAAGVLLGRPPEKPSAIILSGLSVIDLGTYALRLYRGRIAGVDLRSKMGASLAPTTRLLNKHLGLVTL